MNLSQIQINPRLRGSWEAADLGFTLARQWYFSLFLAWGIPSLVFLLLLAVIFQERLWIATLVVWFLKPVWDCAPIYTGSRALFGEKVSVREAVRAIPGFLRPDWFAWLTWRRLSPSRSFALPVTGLERLKGRARTHRLGLLLQHSASQAPWLTFVCVLFEGVLALGIYGLILILLPESMDVGFEDLTQSTGLWSDILSLTLSWLPMAIIAPFYTMGGFALYINRRIELEGWDIEISFRRFAEQRQQQAKTINAASRAAQIALGLMLGALLTFGSPEPVQAAETYTRAQSHKLITEVVDNEVFHSTAQKSGWRLKKQHEKKDEDNYSWLEKLFDWLSGGSNTESGSIENTIKFIAQVFELLIWGLVIGLAAWVLYRFRTQISKVLNIPLPERFRPEPAAPEVLFGLDVTQGSLPENVTEEAGELWAGGHYRKAVGLLYRATLSELIHRHNCRFVPGNTELECSGIVVGNPDVKHLHGFVKRLTDSWLMLAYGRKQIPDKTFESLCRQWQEVFP